MLTCLFPPRCPVCGGLRIPWESSTCPECAGVLRFISEPVCFLCGREIRDAEKEYCTACETKPPSVTQNFAVWQYDKAMKASVAAFKYGGRKEYADFYVRHMVQKIGRRLLRNGVTVLVPVPVSRQRRRYRGFNQAELLSEKLAQELGIVSVNLLLRRKNTAPQSSLAPAERQKNLAGAIMWNERAAQRLVVCPEAVAVVDDIYTTGSTMSACVDVLKKHGIQRVYGACICIGND